MFVPIDTLSFILTHDIVLVLYNVTSNILKLLLLSTGRGSSVGYASAWYAEGRGFGPHVRQICFVEIHVMSTAILYLPLIPEVQLLLAKECAISTGKLPGRLAQD